MGNFIKRVVSRWKAKTPLFFKRIMSFCLCVSGTAIAIHSAIVAAGATEPGWWVTLYPYLVGIPAGAAAVAKFTQTYDDNGNPIK